MNFALLGLENFITIGLFIISIIITSYAQFKIKSAYGMYKKVRTKHTGLSVAREILDKNGLSDVRVVQVRGELTDHYDPARKVVRLSEHIYKENTIAAVSVAAHEVGHAIQDKEGYVFMRIRAMLVPVVRLVTYIGYFSIFIAFLAGITQYLMVGIYILLATLLFQLVTLPVEFDASKKAKSELMKHKFIDAKEKNRVDKMLSAAALTYVAAMVATLLNIMRLLIMLRGRD